MPSEISAWSHRVRFCLSNGISSSSGPVRAAPASIRKQHERQQSCHFSIVRKEGPGTARQADCLTREVETLQARSDAAGVAFVEDEIEHMQNGRQPIRAALRERAAGTELETP